MRENEVAALVGFGVALRFARGSAGGHDRLEIIRHGIAVKRIPIPGFEGEQCPDFLLHKFPGERDARIKPAVVPHLEHQLRGLHAGAQLLAFLHSHAERLFDEHMFAGGNGLEGERHMELIGHPDEDGFDARVSEHFIVIAVAEPRLVQRGHAVAKVVGQVTNGGQLDVPRFPGRIEMGDLRDRSAAENAQPKEARVFVHGTRLG